MLELNLPMSLDYRSFFVYVNACLLTPQPPKESELRNRFYFFFFFVFSSFLLLDDSLNWSIRKGARSSISYVTFPLYSSHYCSLSPFILLSLLTVSLSWPYCCWFSQFICHCFYCFILSSQVRSIITRLHFFISYILSGVRWTFKRLLDLVISCPLKFYLFPSFLGSFDHVTLFNESQALKRHKLSFTLCDILMNRFCQSTI